ncbi:RepB family plasmid replication initiator protein [Clostridium estertheticum]|uniref:replication initiation protein n=1 Tax=Clostridium estertheticum TaxID=238834 RepID=UPI001CF4D9F2|nr:RepB family plasmid replication initiator protein [Clostridium estertheticum]MCB2307329.1 RepB family plasmid replication initiator protein [Clostridium estertheticum]MCB2344979.1 RepB family plasmid replication initiator protein [Clostridium estertheticum]MCB2349859.1 RepB family plasmid replication initiator protein [Clostridium estertheticum]WAG48216.1 RepB family plasmid replication initiator protein [Clostridium estertheticum]
MKKKGELIAVRPEKVIEARFSLTSRQNDILDMLFTQIEDDHNVEYSIDINKYKMLYNIKDKNNIYGDLKKAVKSFEGKGFLIVDKEKNEEIYYPWFSKIHYKNKEGKILLRIDGELKNMFLEVKKRIYYHIKYTLNFSCIYSKRFYYYLKSYEDTGWRIDNLDALRDKLQCPKSYKKYSDFRRFALEPAHEEINNNSDIRFKYEEVKTGNKVTALKFSIRSSKCEEAYKVVSKEIVIDSAIDPEIIEVQNIFSINITPLEVRRLLDVSNGDIELIKEKYKISNSQGKINNIVGWVIEAIKKDYMPQVKQEVFNDYPQREYDFDDLEKKLLGW